MTGDNNNNPELPDTEPMEAQKMPGEDITAPTQEEPITLTVIGSSSWESPALVFAALEEWHEARGRPPVTLITSMCPVGAEQFARTYGQNAGWTVGLTDDRNIISSTEGPVMVFSFDFSTGIEDIIDKITATRSMRVIRDGVSTPESTTPDPWQDR